ncbi:MAG: HDIG domain-containing protein, partial [Clostridia bacterium]|nr:HDIG domain-containing protein [Clostridia bacterium]
MVAQSKKIVPWTRKDYVFSILQFVLHTMILVLIVVGYIFIEYLEEGGIVSFFSDIRSGTNFIYTSIFILLISITLYFYLFFEYRDFLREPKNVALVFVVMEFCLIISMLMGKYVNIFARPAALFALLMLLLINKHVASFVNFLFCLLTFIIDIFITVDFDYFMATAALVISCCSSVLAIYLVDGIGSRIRVFLMGFIVAIPIMIYAALSFLINNADTTVARVFLEGFYGFIGGMTSVVIMMAVLPIFEWAFNVLTNYRLAEITDHKSKLIKKLIENAGGTFNHSTVVASLAENCATAIGENPLLARACAYYHDIGKLKQPIYFTENQHGYNPHDDLTPELSTEIIRSHAVDGYELIRKYHLPQILADVAIEHHGTLP